MKTYKVSVTLDYYVEADNVTMAENTIGSALGYGILPTTSDGDDDLVLSEIDHELRMHLGEDAKYVGKVISLPTGYWAEAKEE